MYRGPVFGFPIVAAATAATVVEKSVGNRFGFDSDFGSGPVVGLEETVLSQRRSDCKFAHQL